MKLYFVPQLCSLVPHVVLRELGASFELVRFNLKTKLGPEGVALSSITKKDYVPVLELDDGERITEVSAIVRYLADSHPESRLAPPTSDVRLRARFDELLHFVASELHKGFAPYTLMPDVGETAKAWTKARLLSRLDLLRDALGEREYLFGDRFTVIDAYAFWAIRATSFLTKTPLEGTLKDYFARLSERPSIKDAVAVEKRA